MSWVLKEVKFTILTYFLSVVFVLLNVLKNEQCITFNTSDVHDDTLGFHGCVWSTLPSLPLCRIPLKKGKCDSERKSLR